MKAKKWITNNLGLKILCLGIAIVTWFYVTLELTKLKSDEEKAIFSMLRYDVISKELPIQPTIVSEVRGGYRIITDGISVSPETCVVIGPAHILNEVNLVRTVPIDISEYTKDVTKEVELAPIARGITLRDTFVTVHIPIVKSKKKSPEPVE